MGNLEKFILDHKEDFDVSRHPEKGWKELESKMSPGKKDWAYLWKVAAVLFFTSTSALILSEFNKKEPTQIVNISTNDSIEGFFVELIDYKRKEYLSLANESEREELFLDIADLDSAYVTLKGSFTQLETQELLDAMLENLQLRLYILNEQIEILKNSKRGDEEVYHSS